MWRCNAEFVGARQAHAALQTLTPPAPHTSECYTSYELHEAYNVPHGHRYRLQISVNGCKTEEVYSQHEMGGVA
jgi:6-pyruvoyl-tetrahydropterin synthase